MNENERRRLLGFYENELTNHLLYFGLVDVRTRKTEVSSTVLTIPEAIL